MKHPGKSTSEHHRELRSQLHGLWQIHGQQVAALRGPAQEPKCATPSHRQKQQPHQEEALAFSRKLIEAQEQERGRIARDLHDDINQRLAMLAIEVELLEGDLPDSGAETSRRLAEMRERIIEVSKRVQSISYELHSPQLEYVGIVTSMQNFCREFAARQRLKIEFTHDKVPGGISYDVSLCLFRIMQEALSNAAKHSKARDFEVKLACSANELHLIISDHGTGFSAKTAMNKGGLGLISMRERAKMANGTIVIRSNRRDGTTIDVRVPIGLQQAFQQAAG